MRIPFAFFAFFSGFLLWGQTAIETERLGHLKNQLDSLTQAYPNYSQVLKVELDFEQLSIADFLQAVAKVHAVNITLDPSLKNRFMTAQFSDIRLDDLLLFLCKTHTLTLTITGNIVFVSPYSIPPAVPPEPFVFYDLNADAISLDVKNHALGEVFKEITRQSPFNLLFTPELAQRSLQFFVEDMPLETALKQLAALHQMEVKRSKEGFFLFEAKEQSNNRSRLVSSSDLPFELFADRHHFSINAKDHPIGPLIEALVDSLDVDWYQSIPLNDLGHLNLKMASTSLDELLPLLFPETTADPVVSESKDLNNRMTFKKENNVYFFGPQDDILLRSVEKIILKHRTVSLLKDPYRENTNASTSLQNNFRLPNTGQDFNNTFNSSGGNSNSNVSRSQMPSTPTQSTTLLELIPEALQEGLQIQVDQELNALLVLGSAQKVTRFRAFVNAIDQPVSVILIEVMLIEVNKTAELDTGISWGIGDAPVTDKGTLFPGLDHQLSATTVNRILGGYNQLTALNLGKLQPNFFLQLKALEESGTVKVLSSPKMATLNGHRAVFSNSETSYYAYTSQNFYGFQNPQTSEITNYIPISAGLTLSVKPYVTGDNGVTLDLFVQQSAFNNTRIAEDAPPGIESREFSSIVRMRNKDIAILGGLEQNTKNDAGRGVPFLARVPLIKWLFSQKTYSRSKRKLTVLIQPTLIQ